MKMFTSSNVPTLTHPTIHSRPRRPKASYGLVIIMIMYLQYHRVVMAPGDLREALKIRLLFDFAEILNFMTFYLLKLGVLEEGLGLVAVKGREGKTTLLWGNSGIMERERPPEKGKVKVKGLVEKEHFNNAAVSIYMQRKDLNQRG